MTVRQLMITAIAIGLLAGPAITIAQLNDGSPIPLPFEPPGEPDSRGELLGTNSFGPGLMLPGLHNEELPTPPIDELITPPIGPPRIYLTIRYYGCRPWLIHPFTGAALKATDIVSSVRTTNPAWASLAQGKTLEELLEVNDELGEPLVTISDEGVVTEDNEVATREWQQEQEEELKAAQALDAQPADTVVRAIHHAPFYGLYCLKVRICVPILTATVPRNVYRYWVRFPYRVHQRVCWRRWWWFRRFATGGIIRPWRPLCVPRATWLRSGPDWVWTVYNVNRYRRWCLFGLRYFFTPFGTPPLQINRVPRIASLNSTVLGSRTWLRPWPIPKVKYWIYRPLSCRWYWFRCVPWFTYRYLPPVVQAAFALPKDSLGAGFIPLPRDLEDQVVFPDDPPKVEEGKPFEPEGGDGFAENFDTTNICAERPLVAPMADGDGSGNTSRQDFPRNLLQERGFDVNPDTEDKDEDDNNDTLQ